MTEELTLRCAVCGSPITRDADYGPLVEFVHVDDEVRFEGAGPLLLRVMSRSNYGHDAVPDVIDVEPRKEI